MASIIRETGYKVIDMGKVNWNKLLLNVYMKVIGNMGKSKDMAEQSFLKSNIMKVFIKMELKMDLENSYLKMEMHFKDSI